MADLQPPIFKMPNELLLGIAGFLPAADLASFARTCQRHHKVFIRELYAIAAQITDDDFPPIYWAAEKGYYDVVQEIIARNRALATKSLKFKCEHINTSHECTALHWAARGSDPVVVSKVIVFFLDKRADVNARDDRRATPLHWACRDAGVEAVETLLNRGANPEALDAEGDTPIKWTARTGNEPAFRLLIGRGVDLNRLNVKNETVLHKIFHQGLGSRSGLVRALLESQGFNKQDMLPQRDIRGYTAFHLAATYGDSASVKLMLDAGYPVDGPSAGGETALLLATEGRAPDVVALLLDSGANPNPDGEYAILSVAVGNGDLDIIGRLMGQAEDAAHVDADGDTPLHWSVKCGSVQVVRYLVNTRQVNVNAKNERGMTPLIQLCDAPRPQNAGEIAGILLGVAGIDVDAQDEYGRTALLAATLSDRLVLVRALLGANANQYLGDNAGNFPSNSWNDQILEALENAGGASVP